MVQQYANNYSSKKDKQIKRKQQSCRNYSKNIPGKNCQRNNATYTETDNHAQTSRTFSRKLPSHLQPGNNNLRRSLRLSDKNQRNEPTTRFRTRTYAEALRTTTPESPNELERSQSNHFLERGQKKLSRMKSTQETVPKVLWE